MVRHFGNAIAGIMTYFGNGTTRIRIYPLKSRPGAQLELTTCNPTPIGNSPQKSYGGPKVVMDFTSEESVDVMIDYLREIKKLLKENHNGSKQAGL